jgi:hypothetical protein
MCKEMPVIPVNKVVDQKNNRIKWRAEEEERHKGIKKSPWYFGDRLKCIYFRYLGYVVPI